MDKKTYLTQLANHLKDLPKEEFEEAMHYVEEYFAEAGEENEANVIEQLAPPLKYAAQIKAEATIRSNRSYQQERSKTPATGIKAIWYIIAGIFALPLAFPIALLAFCLILTLVLLLFSFGIAAFAVMFAAFICAIPLFFSSFAMFSISIPSGFMAMGASITLIGFAIFLSSLAILFFSRFIPWIIKLLSNLFNRLKGGSKDEK